MCMSILLLYCEIFMSVALIVVEIFTFLHGPLLWLILYKSIAYKNKCFHGILIKIYSNVYVHSVIYCEIFMSVALIVVEIFAFLHGPLLWERTLHR